MKHTEVSKELEEIRRHPATERREMVALFEQKDFTAEGALIMVGFIKGKLTSLNIPRSVTEIVVVGGISAGGRYLLGSIIPHLLGY